MDSLNWRSRARNSARITREQRAKRVGRAKRVVDDPRNLPADIAPCTDHAENAFAAIALAVNLFNDVIPNDIESFLPSDTLKGLDVSSILALPDHRIAKALLMIAGLNKIKATRTQTTFVVREKGIALCMVELSVLHVIKHTATVVASRRRPLETTLYGELTFLPRELPFVIELIKIDFRHLFTPRLKSKVRELEATSPEHIATKL